MFAPQELPVQDVVAEIGGGSITLAALGEHLSDRLIRARTDEYNIERQLLTDYLGAELLAR